MSLSGDKSYYYVEGSTPCMTEFKWIKNNDLWYLLQDMSDSSTFTTYVHYNKKNAI